MNRMKPPIILKTIRQILLKDWDPFGVGLNLNLADEYDRYVPRIYRMLKSDSPESKLFIFSKALKPSLERK